MIKSLKARAINGIIWSIIEKYSQQFLRLIISVILARLLSPEQFGLIGMLAVFIGVSQAFVESGLGSALIRKKDPTDLDFSTVFYFNLLISITFYIGLFFSAPLIAKFFNEPRLIILTRILSLTIIIEALGLIHNIKIQKNIEFKKIAKVSFISVFISGLIGVILAVKGFGVWSLIAYQVSFKLIMTCLFWIFDRWRPVIKFNYNSFKELFSFGFRLLISGLLFRIFDNIYNIIIGKFYSAYILGFYERGKRFKDIIVMNFISSIQAVTYPIFSEIQDDKLKLHLGYKRTLTIISFILFPVIILLILVAKPLFLLLLGQKWFATIQYFQLLCIVGLEYPISSLNLNMLKVMGRSDIFLKMEIVKQLLRTLILLISLKWGITGILYGQIILGIISYFINSFYSKELIGLSSIKQIIIMAPFIIISSMCFLTAGLFSYVIDSNLLLVVSESIAFIGLYLLINKLLKINAYSDIRSIIKELLESRDKRTL